MDAFNSSSLISSSPYAFIFEIIDSKERHDTISIKSRSATTVIRCAFDIVNDTSSLSSEGNSANNSSNDLSFFLFHDILNSSTYTKNSSSDILFIVNANTCNISPTV